jgi:hypothetical protein
VGRGRRRDHERVDSGGDHGLGRGDGRRSDRGGGLARTRCVGVGQRHTGDALEAAERRGVERPDPADADDADVHGSAYSKRLHRQLSNTGLSSTAGGRAAHHQLGLEHVQHLSDGVPRGELEQERRVPRDFAGGLVDRRQRWRRESPGAGRRNRRSRCPRAPAALTGERSARRAPTDRSPRTPP